MSYNLHNSTSRVLSIILVIMLVSAGATAGVVTAQDGTSPGEPASFYGPIVDEDNTPAPAGTEVFAVVNGNVEDSIEVEEAGQYGGEGTFADRLEVNTGAGDEIDFVVNDPNGTASTQSPYQFNGSSGLIEVDLTFPSGTFEESSSDDGSDDDSNTDNEDDTSSDDGAGGGGGGGATADDGQHASDGSSPSVTDITDRLQVAEPNTDTTTTIDDATPDAAGITAQPDGTESVREITFENEEATGSVSIREYTNTDSLPQSLRDEIADSTTAAGATTTNSVYIVSVSDITPDTEAAEDSAARVTFSVPAEEVDNPDQLTVVKQSFDFAQQADTWKQMDTSVEQATGDEITVTTEVDRFSVFILTEEPAPTTDSEDGDTDNTTSTDDTETGDGAPGFGVITAIVALVAAALVVHKNRAS